MDTVRGRVAFITGAGSGIGRATALCLARRGAHVVVTDIDEARTESVRDDARAVGARAIAARVDVADLESVEAARRACFDEFGRVDIVMSNVGIIAKGLLTEIPLDAWERVLDVNVMGMVRVLRTFLPDLLAQRSGHVITTGSASGLFPSSYDRLPYSASKGAVIQMTEAMALWLEPKGIGVSCLCPAGVMTNIVEQVNEYGPPTGSQVPRIPVVTAEEVGERVVEGMLSGQFLLTSHDDLYDFVRDHGADMDAFLQHQLEMGLTA